jgi:hypothetical protein
MRAHFGPITLQYLHFHLRDASWLKLFAGCYQLWLRRPHLPHGCVHSFNTDKHIGLACLTDTQNLIESPVPFDLQFLSHGSGCPAFG